MRRCFSHGRQSLHATPSEDRNVCNYFTLILTNASKRIGTAFIAGFISLVSVSVVFVFFFGEEGLELCHHSTLMTDWLTTVQADISRFRQNGSWALLGGSVCKILWQIVIIFMCSFFSLLFFFVFFHYVQNWEGSYFDIFHPYCESGNFWILFAGGEGNCRGGTSSSSTSDNMLSPDTLPSSLTVIVVVVVIISGVSGWAVFCLFDNSIKIIYKLH